MENFMSTGAVARLLGLSADAVRYHERLGHLLAFKIDRQRVFIRQDVERFQRQRLEQGVEKPAVVNA